VFECYLDDSGTSGLPVVTMGGFLGFQGHWENLEPILDEILNGYGVEVFHAKQFHDTKPPFKGWKKIKKLSFTEELFLTTHGMLHGLSMTMSRAALQESKKEGAFASMSPIGVCFSSIVTRLVTDPKMSAAVRKNGVSLLIESGNANNGELEVAFHMMSKLKAFEGVFRSISFVTKESCRAIQLADFIAFYSRRLMRNHARFKGKLALPPCPYLNIMARHGPIWHGTGFNKPESMGVNSKNLKSLDEVIALTKAKK
jgi:hypothetical protein